MRRKNLRECFTEKTKTDPATGCVLWQGWEDHGRGVMRVGGKPKAATHIAIELATGFAPPPRSWVRPSCGSKNCVNAAHLVISERNGRGVRRQTVAAAERLAAKTVPDPHSECQLWTGGKTIDGYGRIGFDGKSVAVHRLAYVLASGQSIPDGLMVRHRCDTPLCVNPAHLELGTAAENHQDRRERGRMERGRNFFPQLTAEDRAIMLAAREKGWSFAAVAAGWALSVSATTGALRQARVERELRAANIDN